jgi:formamidopyrimidine-DNA glycosylase
VVYGGAAPRRGPDALGIACEDFVALLKGRRRQVKALLLDQAVLGGMGNIYTDEALFRAGIHPRAIAARLSRARLERLWREMRAVLTEAIAAGGSSISDYVDARGERGGFQAQHRVYGRAGQPCRQCGTALKRMLVAQRGTSYCPRCQRR